MIHIKDKYKAGFTIAELLVALAITGVLLAAVAVAFNASSINYRENENLFLALNSARQALSQMTTRLRTANAVDPNSSSSQCAFIDAGGANITYRYDSTGKKMYLDDSSGSHVICSNITAASFTKKTFIYNSVLYVKSVQISLTVKSNDVTKAVSAGVVIRRNLIY